MPNNFFLTGLPKTGKTTLLRKLARALEARGYKVGGFLSPNIAERGTREGFYVENIATGKRAPLADRGAGGPRVGKYRVDVKGFESVALPCLENGAQYDIFFIDEIGKMELESEKFGDALADVLQTPLPVIASLHGMYVSTYEIYGTVYRLTEANRGAVYVELLNELQKTLKKKPPKKLAFEKVDHAAEQMGAKMKAAKKEKQAKKAPVKKESPKPKKEKREKEAPPTEKPAEEKKKRGLLDRIIGWFRG